MIVLWLLACWPDYPTDWDGDGWDAPEDCDPTDPAVSPGAQEIWYDGFDQDCDGADDFVADGDGWPVDQE